MPTYTFSGPAHGALHTTVTAPIESEARALAMAARHTPGQMAYIGARPPYAGRGLDLVKETPDP
jgi:hypothetical protein